MKERLYWIEPSHGKAPRGRGRWAFEFPGGRMAFFDGTFTEAKARTPQEAQSQFVAHVSVRVMP